MNWFAPILQAFGPWAVAALMLAAYIFARNRGMLVTKSEIDRSDKNTDRTLKLYEKQIELGAAANSKKDETIAKQAEQIERLLSHSHVSATALAEIVGEAKRRGLVPEKGE